MNAPNETLQQPAKEVIEFAENELVGRLLHVVVSQLESLKTPWHLTAEHNQEIRIANMRSELTTAVVEAVKTIVTERVPSIVVSLGKVEFSSDGIKATITLSRSAAGRHELADKTGSSVFLQLAEPERFIGGGEKVHGDPDQHKLNLPDGETADDEESRPEVRPFEDGFMIYKDEMPIAGAQKFATIEDAEKHIRDFLGFKDPETASEEPPAPPDYESMKGAALRKLIEDRTGEAPPASATRGTMIEMLKSLDASSGESAPE